MKESQPSISNEAVASSPPGDSSSENAISTEEKVERAKELIEQKREAKEMEEKEVCYQLYSYLFVGFVYAVFINGIMEFYRYTDKCAIIRKLF